MSSTFHDGLVSPACRSTRFISSHERSARVFESLLIISTRSPSRTGSIMADRPSEFDHVSSRGAAAHKRIGRHARPGGGRGLRHCRPRALVADAARRPRLARAPSQPLAGLARFGRARGPKHHRSRLVRRRRLDTVRTLQGRPQADYGPLRRSHLADARKRHQALAIPENALRHGAGSSCGYTTSSSAMVVGKSDLLLVTKRSAPPATAVAR